MILFPNMVHHCIGLDGIASEVGLLRGSSNTNSTASSATNSTGTLETNNTVSRIAHNGAVQNNTQGSDYGNILLPRSIPGIGSLNNLSHNNTSSSQGSGSVNGGHLYRESSSIPPKIPSSPHLGDATVRASVLGAKARTSEAHAYNEEMTPSAVIMAQDLYAADRVVGKRRHGLGLPSTIEASPLMDSLIGAVGHVDSQYANKLSPMTQRYAPYAASRTLPSQLSAPTDVSHSHSSHQNPNAKNRSLLPGHLQSPVISSRSLFLPACQSPSSESEGSPPRSLSSSFAPFLVSWFPC